MSNISLSEYCENKKYWPEYDESLTAEQIQEMRSQCEMFQKIRKNVQIPPGEKIPEALIFSIMQTLVISLLSIGGPILLMKIPWSKIPGAANLSEKIGKFISDFFSD